MDLLTQIGVKMFAISRLKANAFLVAGLLVLSPSTNANLIGDTITVEMTGFNAETINVLVGDNVEIDSNFGNLISPEFIDIGASSISGYWEGVLFDNPQTIILSDMDWSGMSAEIVGITNFSSTDADFAASAISFSADSITIDLSGLVATGNWSFDILTQDVTVDPGQVTISEPSVVGIFGLVLAGIGFARRRKAE